MSLKKPNRVHADHPKRIASMLAGRRPAQGPGANFIRTDLLRGFAICQGKRLTGRQRFALTGTAELIIEAPGA